MSCVEIPPSCLISSMVCDCPCFCCFVQVCAAHDKAFLTFCYLEVISLAEFPNESRSTCMSVRTGRNEYSWCPGSSVMLWFRPRGQLNTLQPLAHSTAGEMGKRIGSVKVRELVCWDKDCLIGKVKAVCVSKSKQGVHSPHSLGRQVFSYFWESRSPSHLMASLEDKWYHSECPSLLSCPDLCAEQPSVKGYVLINCTHP